MEGPRNYYQILNIEKNASFPEIKSAYLREAKTTHPDHNKGKEDEFVKKFQELTESYKTLSDPKLRATYDRNLELKAHLVTKPNIMETFQNLISDKGTDSLGKREFASFLSTNGNRSGQFTADETKRVKLEHVFQFERQGDSFKFHRQPLDANKSGEIIATSSSMEFTKQKKAKHKTEDPLKSKSSKIIDVAQNLLSLSQLKSTDISKPPSNNDSVKLPSFKIDSSQEFKNASLNSYNSYSGIIRNQGSQVLPPPSNFLSSGSFYNSSITLQTSLDITFNESVFGCTKNILIKRQTICPHCSNFSLRSQSTPHLNNTSENNNTENTDGNAKNGLRSSSTPLLVAPGTKSEVPSTSQSSPLLSSSNSFSSKEFIKLPLPNKSPADVCKTCNGNGIYSDDARLTISVPAGIMNGSRQVLKNEGDVSVTGKKGDFIVIFKVEPHPFLRRLGNCDVSCDLPLSFAQACLGSTLQIPSIYGPVQVEIPSGIQHGEVVKLLDKGFCDVNDPSKRGDMIVRILIQIPKSLTPKQRELLEEFEKLSN